MNTPQRPVWRVRKSGSPDGEAMLETPDGTVYASESTDGETCFRVLLPNNMEYAAFGKLQIFINPQTHQPDYRPYVTTGSSHEDIEMLRKILGKLTGEQLKALVDASHVQPYVLPDWLAARGGQGAQGAT